MQVAGVFLLSLGQASVNLRMLASASFDELVRGMKPDGWYEKELFTAALDKVTSRFADPAPMLERVGFEMMRLWYEHGPGRSIVSNGPEFLRFQSGSEGYRSLVRGTEEETGGFFLTEMDDAAGRALMVSTTPFPRALERGVLLGGIQLGGGVDFVGVDNSADPSRFTVLFR